MKRGLGFLKYLMILIVLLLSLGLIWIIADKPQGQEEHNEYHEVF